jgi:hypothetical protein
LAAGPVKRDRSVADAAASISRRAGVGAFDKAAHDIGFGVDSGDERDVRGLAVGDPPGENRHWLHAAIGATITDG